MSLLAAYCFDNLRSIGGANLKSFGLVPMGDGSVYYSSTSWTQFPCIDEAGWMCAVEGNGVGEYRGQYLLPLTFDKTKVYWFGARYRNVNNAGYALFRLASATQTPNDLLLSNGAALGFVGGTGTPEVFLEIEIDFPGNKFRVYKDGALISESALTSFAQLYSDINNGRELNFGVPFKNATAWTNNGAAKVSPDQFKVRDIYIVVDDGIGVTKRLGPVNIKRAPVTVTGVVGANKDAAAAQTILNQPLVNTASGGAWSKAAGTVKLTDANSAVNFKLDLSAIPGKVLAAGVLVGGRRSAAVIPQVDISQTVDGTKYTTPGAINFTTTTADVVNWTRPRTEFVAANVPLASVDFSITLKDPA
jgi:hypothetical protein